MIATGMREAPRINYYYAKINYNTMYSRASSMKNGTIARHEIGHALGIAHSNGIMIRSVSTNTNLAVDKANNDILARIYGGENEKNPIVFLLTLLLACAFLMINFVKENEKKQVAAEKITTTSTSLKKKL